MDCNRSEKDLKNHSSDVRGCGNVGPTIVRTPEQLLTLLYFLFIGIWAQGKIVSDSGKAGAFVFLQNVSHKLAVIKINLWS